MDSQIASRFDHLESWCGARFALLRAEIAEEAGNREAYGLWHDAFVKSIRLGMPMPSSAMGSPFVQSAWLEAESDVAMEQQEEEKRWQEQQVAEDEHRLLDLAEANAWGALGMPTPESIVDQLLSGGSTRVCGYYLEFDDAHGLTWYTNPYGCDGILCSKPTVAAIRRLLICDALGDCLGATS